MIRELTQNIIISIGLNAFSAGALIKIYPRYIGGEESNDADSRTDSAKIEEAGSAADMTIEETSAGPGFRERFGTGKQLYVIIFVMLAINIGIAVFLALSDADNTLMFGIRELCLMSLLWPVALIDYKTHRIPNLFIIEGFICWALILASELLFDSEFFVGRLVSQLIIAAAIAGVLLLSSLATKRGAGMGDVKLLVVMCLLLGAEGIWNAIFISLVIAFLTAVFLLATKRKKKRDMIAFAPSIMVGTYISVVLTGV